MAKHILSIALHGTSTVIQYKDNGFNGATVDVLTFDGDNGGAPAFSLPLTVPAPTAAGHAATKAYVDATAAADVNESAVRTALAASTGSIAVNNQKITGLGAPAAGTDAATKTYADNLFAGVTGVVKRTVTIDQVADLAGLGAGVKTFSKNVGAALPANARLIGWTIGEGAFTKFNDGTTLGTFRLDIGTGGDDDDTATNVDVSHATALNFPAGLGSGVSPGVKGYLMAIRSAEQIVAKLTSSVDLNTSNAGSVIINVFYIILA